MKHLMEIVTTPARLANEDMTYTLYSLCLLLALLVREKVPSWTGVGAVIKSLTKRDGVKKLWN